jgi:hypothetical protein
MRNKPFFSYFASPNKATFSRLFASSENIGDTLSTGRSLVWEIYSVRYLCSYLYLCNPSQSFQHILALHLWQWKYVNFLHSVHYVQLHVVLRNRSRRSRIIFLPGLSHIKMYNFEFHIGERSEWEPHHFTFCKPTVAYSLQEIGFWLRLENTFTNNFSFFIFIYHNI